MQTINRLDDLFEQLAYLAEMIGELDAEIKSGFDASTTNRRRLARARVDYRATREEIRSLRN